MHYNHILTGTTYSIFTTIRDGFYNNKPYTFNQGAAKTLADWTTVILSLWSFSVNPITIISGTVGFFSATGLLQKSANGVYTALITRTVTCSYNNQEFYGNATAPSTNYPEGFLEGTYAVVNNNGQTKVITEGFTVRQWGTSTFGRIMMYQVFGIDEAPSSWTGI